MSMRWHGEEFKRQIADEMAKNMEAAAIHLKGEIKQSLAVGNIDSSSPSEAGDPPRRVTGRLSGSIAHEVDRVRLIARVGTNVLYGKFLELGTRKMAARPFIRPGLEKARHRIGRILAGKW